MAKTRAQRKAERRAREAQEARQDKAGGRVEDEVRAQHDTQVPESGDVAEVKAVEVGIEAGAPETALETPDAPKPTRTERRAAQKEERDKERRRKADEKRREQEALAKKQRQAADERSRGRVIGFLASCWAELKRVQWPDRETLIQASAVTIIFVAVAAVYLGSLDALFSFLMDKLL